MKKRWIATVMLTGLTACAEDENDYRVVGELASDRVELTAEFAEPIRQIMAAEGSSVTTGQVLLLQDASRATLRLTEAEAAHARDQARFDELLRGPRRELITAARANVEGAGQELEFRQSEKDRIEAIHRRGLASADVLDRANAASDAAQANLKLRLAQLEELLAGTTIESLSQAEQAARQSAARRDSAKIDLERHTIRAPIDGVLDSRLFEIGERPGIGQTMLVLLADRQPHARIYVPEALRVHIGAGTTAKIYIDGMATPVSGRVRTVATEAAYTPYFALTERDRGRLSFVAKVDVDEDRERLPDGVPVVVQFMLD